MALGGCGTAGGTLTTAWLDTDVGSGASVVIVQGPAAASLAPPLLSGYRLVRLIEPDDWPDPPSWRQALQLAVDTPVVIVTDRAGEAVARALAAEAPETVRGVAWLEAPTMDSLRWADRHDWPTERLGSARGEGVAELARRWLPSPRRTFRIQP